MSSDEDKPPAPPVRLTRKKGTDRIETTIDRILPDDNHEKKTLKSKIKVSKHYTMNRNLIDHIQLISNIRYMWALMQSLECQNNGHVC